MSRTKSRREARIEREAAKKLKAEQKSARLRALPVNEKQPRAGADPGSIFHMMMTWSCDDPDHEGEWSWGVARRWSSEDWATTIEPKLREFERLTWAEIDHLSSGSSHKMHHNMDTDQICDEAQLRLIEIERYDDVMFRFRLGGLPRLWGFRVLAEFQVLWFDPTHQIYPVDPD